MAIYDTEAGKCPKCGAELEAVGELDYDGDSATQDVRCSACEWSGTEQLVMRLAHQCYFDDED